MSAMSVEGAVEAAILVGVGRAMLNKITLLGRGLRPRPKRFRRLVPGVRETQHRSEIDVLQVPGGGTGTKMTAMSVEGQSVADTTSACVNYLQCFSTRFLAQGRNNHPRELLPC